MSWTHEEFTGSSVEEVYNQALAHLRTLTPAQAASAKIEASAIGSSWFGPPKRAVIFWDETAPANPPAFPATGTWKAARYVTVRNYKEDLYLPVQEKLNEGMSLPQAYYAKVFLTDVGGNNNAEMAIYWLG